MLSLSFAKIQTIPAYQESLKKVINVNNQVELEDIKKTLAANDQGWLDLPETTNTDEIKKFANSVKGKYEHIVVLAIGGSSLGPIALKETLLPLYWNELSSKARKNVPTLHIIDNIDPALINTVEQVTDINKTLFIVITKSGRTPETISEYLYFRNQVESKIGPEAVSEHFVFITDPENGLLRKVANKENITTFPIPQSVGGRFSVLTPVGLLPAALMGINIEALLNGAKQVREQFLQESASDNQPYIFAKLQKDLNETHNVNMTALMPYSNRLFKIADWYRQLLAESIGKEVDLDGKKVNTGITPINALGATDQHSQVQLYNEGPKDKLFVIMETEISHSPEIDDSQQITSDRTDDFKYLNKVTFKKLIEVEREATQEALTKYKAPIVSLKIPEINAQEIGGIFMFFEISTGILGELFNIDTYNQPGVELGKVLTKQKLQS